MRGDWLYVDYFRAFMPTWLARATSLKVFSFVVLGLVLFVVALKIVGR